MITLEDITLIPYIMKLSVYRYVDKRCAELYEFLTTNRIYDFKRLEDFMKAGYLIVNTIAFYKKLEQAYTLLARVNTQQKDIQIYGSSKMLSNFNAEITRTDNTTMLSDILITHPVYHSSTPKKIQGISIGTAEYLRGKIVLSGRNALAEALPYIGESRVDHFSYDLFRYRQQLDRVIAESTEFDKNALNNCDNLFYKDYEEKRKIIVEQLNEIITYMLDNGKTFVWGNLAESARNRIKLAIDKDKGQDIKDNFANMITKFVTLGEVEKGLLLDRYDGKPIERFLRK